MGNSDSRREQPAAVKNAMETLGEAGVRRCRTLFDRGVEVEAQSGLVSTSQPRLHVGTLRCVFVELEYVYLYSDARRHRAL